MAIVDMVDQRREAPGIPLLENGDRLDQPTFHERYLAMPEDVRAELIGGIVYLMTYPVRRTHGRFHSKLGRWIGDYADATPGVEALANTSVILGVLSEPQPDLTLRRLPDHGGSSRDRDDDYVEGPPELVVEISTSTAAYDLNQKLADYEHAGVQEYVVALPREREVRWFALAGGHYQPLLPGADGIFRSQVFPGLWLDPRALFEGGRIQDALQQGIASRNNQSAPPGAQYLKPKT